MPSPSPAIADPLPAPSPQAAKLREEGRLDGRGQPRQARAIARRQAILDATLALLGEEGLAALSTSGIAARAGVPVASVYAYFPNKFAIVAELGRLAMAEVDARLEAVLGAATAGTSVAEVIDMAIATVLAGYRNVPGRRHLFAAMRTDSALTEVQRLSDLRMIDAAHAALMALCPALGEMRAAAVAATMVTAFTALQHEAVLCENEGRLPLLVAEWRRMILGYILPYLEGRDGSPA